MARTKISEFSATPGNNTDIDGINLAEGCAPSGINDAIRELMSQLKDWQSGTSNDPMTIGSSGSLTLSYGTANGVAYLNGSKVLTTGSALQFDGTKAYNNLTAPPSGWSGIGTSWWVKQSATDGGFYAIASSSDAGIFIGHNGTIGKLGVSYGSTAGYTPLAFFTNDAEQMRLTSTGLGIGTSSPAGKLEVFGSAYVANNGLLALRNSTPADYAYFGRGGIITGGDNADLAIRANLGSILFSTNGATERMRLDSSGNLGLGVTPSAWSGFKAFDIGATGSVACLSTQQQIGMNYYWNGSNYIYKTTNAASYYNQNSGSHAWFTAPSGTAGDAITSFTQAMTLDASGRLLVGTTSFAYANTNNLMLNPTAGNLYVQHASGTASGQSYAEFTYNATLIGSISQSGTTAVLYNTTSDHRLKENVTPLIGALAKVQALKPSEFDWIDGRHDDGFIAHELQAVLPNVVTGEKDAVDENGNPKYQQVDYARIVPTLCAAIQEQQSIINQLKSRLDAANL